MTRATEAMQCNAESLAFDSLSPCARTPVEPLYGTGSIALTFNTPANRVSSQEKTVGGLPEVRERDPSINPAFVVKKPSAARSDARAPGSACECAGCVVTAPGGRDTAFWDRFHRVGTLRIHMSRVSASCQSMLYRAGCPGIC